MARDDIDAVDIMVPFESNPRFVADAIAAGKHFIVEKPLAASLADARRLVDISSGYSKIAFVAENFRYRPTLTAARTILESGRIGRPWSATWTMLLHIDGDQYQQSEWRQQDTYPGGLMTDAGVHFVSAVRTLFGDVRSGFAASQSVNPKLGEMDAAQILLRTADDVDIAVTVAFSAHGISEDRMVVLGETGAMVIGVDGIDITTDDGGHEHIEVEKSSGYREEFLDFHRAVTTGSAPASSILEGYRDLELILNVIEASKLGQPFTLWAR